MIKYFFPHLSFLGCILCSIVTSLILTFFLCKFIISFCNKKNMVDEVREAIHFENQENKKVPPFGGVAIILSTLISTVLFADLKNIYVQLLLLGMVAIGGVGFYDDFLKVFKKSKQGVKPIIKLFIQGGIGTLISFNIFENNKIAVQVPENYKVISLQTQEESKKVLTKIPFFKKTVVDYNTNEILKYGALLLYAFLLSFIIAGTSNAVNLTDGVDGLALKNSLLTLAVLTFFSILYDNAILTFFTNSLFIKGISETVIFSCALFFSCLTCLWFNAFPAKIFIGDSGSLMLGGVIAILAIFLRIEWFLPILCGLFFIETVTVILQVFYFRYTKRKFGQGKKLFLMSPLHYHLIKKGWPEVNTTTRLTIISMIFTILAVIMIL